MLSLQDIQGRAYIKFDNKQQLWIGKDLIQVPATTSAIRSVIYGHTVLAISKKCYYTLKFIQGSSRVYHYTEIEEFKHLLNLKQPTHSNWYDNVHIMD
jgi:hypothetical protein